MIVTDSVFLGHSYTPPIILLFLHSVTPPPTEPQGVASVIADYERPNLAANQVPTDN